MDYMPTWATAHQAPLSMGFSRQEYWNGLPFSTSGDLPDPGIKPTSLMSPAVQADSLPLCREGEPQNSEMTFLVIRKLQISARTSKVVSGCHWSQSSHNLQILPRLMTPNWMCPRALLHLVGCPWTSDPACMFTVSTHSSTIKHLSVHHHQSLQCSNLLNKNSISWAHLPNLHQHLKSFDILCLKYLLSLPSSPHP